MHYDTCFRLSLNLPVQYTFKSRLEPITDSIIYRYLVGCCPITDLFGKEEPILGEA